MPPPGLRGHGRCHASCCRRQRRGVLDEGVGGKGMNHQLPGAAQGSGEQWRRRRPPRNECGFSTCAGPGRYVHHRGCSFKIHAARFSPEVGATRMGRPSSACPLQCFPRHRARQICWDPLLSSYSPPRSGHSALTSRHSSPQAQQWSLPPLLRSGFSGSW
ncbi:hypothetical protein PVAP13_8KG381200 [Panicum virgatum]|uniref:Uncharacterized protein n=1 Tax=Panicum virgatum TaxID=38727 RepID=A0A8T0PS63_PANVG|nr:hypothetical protein PVAP13_8KG381200 [Panicum virgatum]